MADYQFEKYIATNDTITEILEKYGVAVIPGVLNDIECLQMNNGMWDVLEKLTEKFDIPIKRDETSSWREIQKLYPQHSMLIQQWAIGHAQYLWDIRQNEKVVDIFAKIWCCEREELLVSFDAVSYHMPPEITKFGWYLGRSWFHSDQSFLDSSFKCVQGWVTGYDINEGDATLSILEGSHKFHSDFQEQFKTTNKKDWYKLNSDELDFYIKQKECRPTRIKCPKGSVVLWDSRTIHCGSQALKTREKQNIRNVAYICYEPRERCTEKNLLKKQKAFNEMRMTSHWPCKVKLFSKLPRTYGNTIYPVSNLDKPMLNMLGKRLAGF